MQTMTTFPLLGEAFPEMRTERYTTIRLWNVPTDRPAYLAWTFGNGIVDDSYIILPEVGEGYTVSFHSLCGWSHIEHVLTSQNGYKGVAFDVRFDPDKNANGAKKRMNAIRFRLLHKKDGAVSSMGEVTIPVKFVCAKNGSVFMDVVMNYY